MNPEASGPAIHYYMMRGGSEKKNVTVWESGTVGGEYIKAYGHYHIDDLKEAYEIILGEGILLLQTRQKDSAGNYIDDKVGSFQAKKVKAGDMVAIPPFAGHLLVNTGSTWLVTSDDSPFNSSGDSSSQPVHADYEAVKAMRGFAYYVVEQDGKPTLVKNQNYKEVPEAEIS